MVASQIFYVRADHNYRYVKVSHRFSINEMIAIDLPQPTLQSDLDALSNI